MPRKKKEYKVHFVKNPSLLMVQLEGVHYTPDIKDEVKREHIASLCRMLHEDKTNKDLFNELFNALNPGSSLQVHYNGLAAEDGHMYLGGIPVPLPPDFARVVLRYIEQGQPIEALEKFWMLCLLNPNTRARDAFFGYCLQYGAPITDDGYAVLYKSVAPYSGKKEVDSKQEEFDEYIHQRVLIARSSKKRVNGYMIFKDQEGEYHASYCVSKDRNVTLTGKYDSDDMEQIGILSNLKEEIDNRVEKPLYIPHHSQSKGWTKDVFSLGDIVKKNRKECDPNIRKDCSHGLHVGSYGYVDWFTGSGSTVLAILVNPRDVVAIPEYDTSKIRVCQYYPYAVMKRRNETSWEEITEGHISVDYTDLEWDRLKEELSKLQETLAEDMKRQSLLGEGEIVEENTNRYGEGTNSSKGRGKKYHPNSLALKAGVTPNTVIETTIKKLKRKRKKKK